MWFKNLLVYRLSPGWAIDADAFENKLSHQPLQPCGGFDLESRGWVYPRDEGRFLHTLNRQWLLALGINQKLLPASVVNQVAKDRAAEIAEQQDHPVGRKQMREIRDRVHQELLPRAFTRLRTTRAWIDPVNGWLAIDTAGEARAEELIKNLLQCLDDLPLRRLDTERSPAAAMTRWLAAGQVSSDFTIDQDLELRSSDEGKATVRYVRHALEGKEIRDHIAAGKTATRLGMTWKDRISFVLTEQLQIKRLAFLDILKSEAGEQPEDADEQFDINFALMTGELAHMLADLVEVLGGEKPQEG
ncbi:MAG TPA: recombination-associated protein RdgC [Burkholderiales bacterium]|nr:recombination-associated protein RdgC [Burkholderiales bacterium]